MRKPIRRAPRRGLTLIEVLIASIILAVAAISVMNVFRGSAMGIQKTDEKRELRYYLQEIYAHINRRPLHALWDAFGPAPHANRTIAGAMALVDGSGKLVPDADPAKPYNNPLGFTQLFIDEMRRDGLGAKIWFAFYSRDEDLRYTGLDPDPRIGLRHMQTGLAAVAIYDLKDPDERNLMHWRQPVMCPMIVGRPGIKLSSCPALNDAVKCEYGPKVAAAEGRSWTAEDQADCSS